MEENIKKEMIKIKKELYKKKEEIRDIKTLANKEIDRELPPDLMDFSERELESQLEEHLSYLNQHLDPSPEKMSITSHRKIIGKPIIWIKRILLKITGAYVTHIFEKQKTFNQKCADSYQILLLHQKRHRKKNNQVEERISECEVHLEIVSRKLEELDAKLGQLQNPLAPHKPDTDNK